MSIVTIRASGAIRTSSSTRTDSSFWKLQSITRRWPWRSTASWRTSVTLIATGSSTGVSSCVHHSGSVRPAKSRNVSPSAWWVS